jgi:alcohol dehydrogenase class IV
VVYGRGSIQRLPELLQSLKASKAFIVTGSSLQTKTPVIKEIEGILGDKHIKTYSKIAQHAPISAIREAAEDAKRAGVDVFISVGGGSPIDSVKGNQSIQFTSNSSDCSYIAERTWRGLSSSYRYSHNSLCCRYIPLNVANEKPRNWRDIQMNKAIKLAYNILIYVPA